MGREATACTDGQSIEEGARVEVTDPRTGIRVFGKVAATRRDSLRIDPVGPGYPPGGFVAPSGQAELIGAPGEDVDEEEDRKRTEWDIVCMVLSGALENLSVVTLENIAGSIAEGHI